MLRPSVSQFDLGAHGGKQFASRFNVAHLGNILQNDGFFCEQGSGHRRKGGVLGSADPNCSQQRVAAADHKHIHTPVYSNGVSGKDWAGISYSIGHGLRVG
jgi:hypothetical protein